MKVFDSVEAVVAECAHGPAELGYSEWQQITQERIDLFADATGDHLWIHTDPARAASESPFGSTIAHGYLTLSMVAGLVDQVYRVEGLSMSMNYGIDSLRFLTPVTVGSRIRLSVRLNATKPARTGTQMLLTMTVDIEGQTKPALVADVVYLVVPA